MKNRNRVKKFISLALLLAMMLTMIPFLTLEVYATNVSTFEELQEAIERGDSVITLTNDIVIPRRFTGPWGINIRDGQNITIRGNFTVGIPYSEALAIHQSFIITVGGRDANLNDIPGHLTIDGPTILLRNYSYVMPGSSLTLLNGEIRTPYGIMISENGNFIMEGGNITWTDDGSGHSRMYHGVRVIWGANFTMNGGTISGFRRGVGVHGMERVFPNEHFNEGRFTMNGGNITNNGTGVFVGSFFGNWMEGVPLTDGHFRHGESPSIAAFIHNGGNITGNGTDIDDTRIGIAGFQATVPYTTQPTPAPNLNTASNWAHEHINQAFAFGLIPRSLQNNYTQNTTRAEFAQLAVTLYESVRGEITGREQFNDTSNIYVQKAAYIEVVQGVGGGNFAPERNLTREQAAVMLSRLADILGQPLAAQAATFADNAQVSSWALEAVGQMQATGIMGGVGNNRFAPQGPYTREQSIITIMRLLEILD